MKPLLNNAPLILLSAITIFQWAFISYLLQERHQQHTTSHEMAECTPLQEASKTRLQKKSAVLVQQAEKRREFPGVAAAIFFSAPAWFHRRFPVLIQNVLMNIPSDWAVQLFVHPTFWTEKVLPWHPGLPRLLEQNQHRLLVTELPPHLQKLKQPNQRILLDEWIWNSLLADQVFLFSGNGILCTHGNTAERWNTLTTQFDYVGAPWTRMGRIGGDGATHSVRNRTLMLQALHYAQQHQIPQEPPESLFFVQTLKKMMDDNGKPIRLATRADTLLFAGVQTTNSTLKGEKRPIPPPPMVVSGTQAHLSFQEREDLLLVCPELKVIFPSLHEPACFGAKPDPEGCKATICALQVPLPGSGC